MKIIIRMAILFAAILPLYAEKNDRALEVFSEIINLEITLKQELASKFKSAVITAEIEFFEAIKSSSDDNVKLHYLKLRLFLERHSLNEQRKTVLDELGPASFISGSNSYITKSASDYDENEYMKALKTIDLAIQKNKDNLNYLETK